MKQYPKYKKDLTHSYCFGLYTTSELVNFAAQKIKHMFFAKEYEKSEQSKKLMDFCVSNNIELTINTKKINSLSGNKKILVGAAFNKNEQLLPNDQNHIVLVNPQNLGNLGTIIRSMMGFDYENLAIVGTSGDVWDPTCVTASMGSIFSIKIKTYANFGSYLDEFKQRQLLSFALQTETLLDGVSFESPHSLIFGNEGSGLDESVISATTPIKIKQSNSIDSLNLSTATSIAMYESYKSV
jgi:TrmH family RNA methyltransferase